MADTAEQLLTITAGADVGTGAFKETCVVDS
jgi:hypothetical protein